MFSHCCWETRACAASVLASGVWSGSPLLCVLCSSATCLTSKLDTEAESEVSVGVLQGHVVARATLSLTRPTWRQNCPIGAGWVYKGGAIYKVFISIIEWEELSRAGWLQEVVSLSSERACESSSGGRRRGYLAVYLYPSCLTSYRSDRQANWKLLSNRFLHSSIPSDLCLQQNRKKKKIAVATKGDSWIFMS